MKSITLFSFLFFSIFIYGQSNLPLSKHPKYINANTAYNSNDYQTTINLGEKILDNYFVSADLYALIGKAHLFNGNSEKAAKYLGIAHDLVPINDDFIFFYMIASTYNKDAYNITKTYNEFSYYGLDPGIFDYNNSYMENLKGKFSGLSDYTYTVQELSKAKTKYNQEYRTNAMIFSREAVELYLLPNADRSKLDGDEIFNKLLSLKKRLEDDSFPVSFYNQLLIYVAQNAANANNNELITEELFSQFKNPSTSTFMRYRIYSILTDIYQITRQYDAEVSIANIMFDDIKKVSLSTSMNVKVLNSKMFALIGQDKHKETYELAKVIEPVLDKLTHPEVLLNAHLQTARAYSLIGEKEKGVQLAEKTEALSIQLEFQKTELGEEITRNAERAKIINGTMEKTDQDINSTDFLALYNDGVSLFTSKKYGDAIPFFEKSCTIYKGQLDKAGEKERSELLLFYAKAGGFLVGCYQETKQFDKIFPVIESLKANSLVSRLSSSNEKLITLSQLQQTLKPDEAIVYYTDVSRGTTREGTYVAAVITRESFNTKYVTSIGALMNVYVNYNRLIGEIESEMAQKEFREPRYTQYNSIEEAGMNELRNGEVSLMIELYRKLLNPYEGGEVDPRFTNEMDFGMVSNSFFIDYVSRLEPFFKDKKKIIFALDGMQNLIPFETLVDMNSIYMVEKYDIAYIQSGTVLKSLRDRKPYNYTKNVLAFGDATYEKLSSPGLTLTSLADIDRLKNRVYDWQKENKPLDFAFATFSKDAMTYLSGAKAEVEYIGNQIPNSDTRMGEMMTENEFKRMSLAGELKNYRAIHLSSHASVHPYIFDLSSIAFNVYSTPQGNEDGMLTISEMEKLDIKTDFMMLSACQTGLGKIVPGDGIAGLNQAMFTAGANSTVSTLWSVSDYGSYIFTANLYHKIFNLGMDYDKAVNDVKRQFINGAFNKEGFNGREVRFWAAFIYSGK